MYRIGMVLESIAETGGIAIAITICEWVADAQVGSVCTFLFLDASVLVYGERQVVGICGGGP